MRFKILILLTITLSFYFDVSAQNKQVQFSHLDIRNGLSHNQVSCVYKDVEGFMWFGTLSGLDRYDGYDFKVFKHKNGDSTSINDNDIISINEGPANKIWIRTQGGYNIYDPVSENFEHDIDKQLAVFKIPPGLKDFKKDVFGNFWFVNDVSGIYKYNPVTKKTVHFQHLPGDNHSLSSNNIAAIASDNMGDIWVVYLNGLLEKLDHKRNQVVSRVDWLQKLYGQQKNYYRLFSDTQNDLWIFAEGNPLGVYYFSENRNIFRHIHKGASSGQLNSDIITDITQDDKNTIWLATDHGGLNLLNKQTFKIQYVLNKEDDEKSLSQNSTTSVYKDKSGIIWIGTYKKGISYYHENIIKFPIIKHSLTDVSSLPYNDINRFVEDKKGNLWIATNGKGLVYYNVKTGLFKSYLNNPSNSNSLCSNVVESLCVDYKNRLWIGTYFGGMDCFNGKMFKHYKYNSLSENTISDNRISDILEDSTHKLWIGTSGGGLDHFDPEKEVFTHFGYRTFPRTSSDYITKIIEDEHKNIWMGTSFGITVILNSSGKTIIYNHSDKDKNSLVNDNTADLLEDSRHLLWITTRDGLSIFDPKSQRFITLTKDDGLPDNTLLDVLEDHKHNMWLSSANGLSNIIVSNKDNKLHFTIKNYDEADGLQGREFNQGASLLKRNGDVIFGGSKGFNLFNPVNIRPNQKKDKLIFTELLVFNKIVKPNQPVDNHIILTKSISQTKAITLTHSENVFTLEFAALNFFDRNKVKYKYIMEGFDKEWITVDNTSRKVTYTNLDAGDYLFKVKAINSDNPRNVDYIALNIKIKPPFWKAPLAYVFYLSSILGMLLYIRSKGIKKLKKDFALKQEKIELQRIHQDEREQIKRMHELDMMKIKFFTNVSHEFRTPLSLIMAPVDKMLKNALTAEQIQQVNMIKTNARRLLNLVNQLLDFRKMEDRELKLHTQTGDIVTFVKEISASFRDIADKKHIGFLFDSELDALVVAFDHEKIERVLFNLLSNAFKFTARGGYVTVLVNISNQSINEDITVVEIKIIDTGIGIPEDMHDKIFSRFFQNDIPDFLLNQGSGIGLAITREFVKMHNGNIRVESEPGNGSTFIIELPFVVYPDATSNDLTAKNDDGALEEIEIALNNSALGKTVPVQQTKRPVILIIEDDEDFRFYLKENLKDAYTIVEAVNGKEGWQKALSLHPDIIVSDISMPEMNGIELCKKLKNDDRTFHIPVILLTALIGQEEELKGLQIGANDYMTKPFNFDILLSKIQNLLILQETFKKTYTKQMHLQLEEIEVESADEKLIYNVIDYIQKNMLNPSLSVEDLSRQMNMSRVSLYKKLLAITGKSPVELIRHIKLKKAAQLFEKSQLNITGVCYEVGFNNLTYFSKIFKEEFNMLPSEYVNMIRARRSIEK